MQLILMVVEAIGLVVGSLAAAVLLAGFCGMRSGSCCIRNGEYRLF